MSGAAGLSAAETLLARGSLEARKWLQPNESASTRLALQEASTPVVRKSSKTRGEP
jgi:hypothetical protein